MQKFWLATLALLGLTWPTQISQSPIWAPLITFFVNLTVLALIICVAGLVVLGAERTKIARAFAIAFLGTFANFILDLLFILTPLSAKIPGENAFVFRVLASFVVWLSLTKSFYRTGWLVAFAVAVLVLINMVVLELLLRPFMT